MMKRIILCSSLALCLAAFACGGDDDEKEKADGGPNSQGTGCAAFVCDSNGIVRQGSIGANDEYSASSRCSYKDIGVCKEGCDTDRVIVKLPGCDVGNACTVRDREFPAIGDVTANTACSASSETLADNDSCNGRPCLSRSANGLPIKPFFCAVTMCDSNDDCAADEFCRCLQEKQDDGTYVSERWCVKKP